jgi:hypothetical protein
MKKVANDQKTKKVAFGKSFLILATIILMGITATAQTNAVVAIAKKKTNCNTSDLGYQWYSGDAKTYELSKKAKSRVRTAHPTNDYVEVKDNNDWGTYLGDYMVIISATTTLSSGCQRYTYGVGFGKSRNSAIENAKSHLSSRNWSWSESKNGFSVVEEKRL